MARRPSQGPLECSVDVLSSSSATLVLVSTIGFEVHLIRPIHEPLDRVIESKGPTGTGQSFNFLCQPEIQQHHTPHVTLCSHGLPLLSQSNILLPTSHSLGIIWPPTADLFPRSCGSQSLEIAPLVHWVFLFLLQGLARSWPVLQTGQTF